MKKTLKQALLELNSAVLTKENSDNFNNINNDIKKLLSQEDQEEIKKLREKLKEKYLEEQEIAALKEEKILDLLKAITTFKLTSSNVEKLVSLQLYYQLLAKYL